MAHPDLDDTSRSPQAAAQQDAAGHQQKSGAEDEDRDAPFRSDDSGAATRFLAAAPPLFSLGGAALPVTGGRLIGDGERIPAFVTADGVTGLKLRQPD
jgi:hypothetical protein